MNKFFKQYEEIDVFEPVPPPKPERAIPKHNLIS